MKFIVINGRKLGVVVIMIGLMIVLIGLGIRFDDKLKYTALIHENISELKEYSIPNTNINYKLPEKWSTNVEKFKGGEIVYHNNFISEDFKIYGFIQFWDYKKDLKQFLDESKDISDKENINKDYKIKEIKVNEYDGYLVTYTTVDKQKEEYVAYEYFIKDKEKFIRFSFFVRKDNFKANMPFIFKGLVNTLNINETA